MKETSATTAQPVRLVDIARVFDPARLTQARRIARMSKTELHQRVGVSAAAVGQYERGEVKPRAETIAALADALQVPPGFFALGRPRAHVEIAEASFRRLRATTVTQQQQATAYVEQVWELSCYLEEAVEFPELDLPEWALPESQEVADPITAAQLLRRHWNLGTEPVGNLVAEIEQRGILVVLFSMKEDGVDEKSRIDAFSTTALSRPVIVLTPDKADDVLRHRFSAAHEVGHILLHHGRLGTDSEMERQADQFAAEFLTPRGTIETELPRRVNFDRLETLSRRWGVSVNSLLYRMRELELVSDSTARRAYITLNSIPRRSRAIRDFPGEQPELLRNAIELLDSVGIPLPRIAEDLQLHPKRVRQLAGIDDPKPRLSLVRHPDVRPPQAAPLVDSERETEEKGG